MSVTLFCPRCRTPVPLTDELRGRQVQCRRCLAVLNVAADLGNLTLQHMPTVGQAPILELASEVPSPRPAAKSSSAMLIVGILGAVGLVVLMCGGIMIALLLPAVQQAREAARRTQCRNNLKQIGVALHNYHNEHNVFPPAYIADAQGKPMHSWRVLILPYLGEDAPELYKDYDFSQPWDSPKNRELLKKRPAVYDCPSHDNRKDYSTTPFAAVVGEHCAFRGSQPTRIADFTDGTSNTMMIGEASKAEIPWTKPEDVEISRHGRLGDPAGFGSDHARGFNAIMADGSVRFISTDVDKGWLQAAYTINGGEANNSSPDF